MTVIDFLLARIAEDEERLPSRARLDSADQRRWRADCDAKRRIVGMRVNLPDEADGVVAMTLRKTLDAVLAHLADAYADHPNY